MSTNQGTILRLVLVTIAACLLSTGCHTASPEHPAFGIDRLPPVYDTLPRELSKVVLPEYVIEPPDILAIEGIHIVPKPPYRLKTLDVLSVQATNTLPDAPIAGSYAIEPGGVINLGLPYGNVRVAGMTIEEAKLEIESHLANNFLRSPQVTVSLVQLAAAEQIFGQFLVGPDGTITLGSYGQIPVVGMTVPQAKEQIELHLSTFLEDPEVAVNVLAFNSKSYYIVVQGAGLGDGVYKFPVTGNDTVLDAIANIQGLEQVSSKKLWIARPTRDSSRVQIIPVDWYAVTERGTPDTNYQLFPGDRVFIAEDRMVAFDTWVAKFTSPLERIMGFTLLGTGTVTRLSGPVLRGGGNPNNTGI